jgi:hypothetical protein
LRKEPGITSQPALQEFRAQLETARSQSVDGVKERQSLLGKLAARQQAIGSLNGRCVKVKQTGGSKSCRRRGLARSSVSDAEDMPLESSPDLGSTESDEEAVGCDCHFATGYSLPTNSNLGTLFPSTSTVSRNIAFGRTQRRPSP